MKKKVAFFLDNSNLLDKDYTCIVNGNPGVGGSEYEFLLVSYLLDQRQNGIECVLLHNSKIELPHTLHVYIDNLGSACKYCQTHGINTLVIDIKSFNKITLDKYCQGIDIVLWLHNSATYSSLNLFNKLPYIKKLVNVGREQLELYRDHMATLKSTYIYNIIPIKEKSFYLSKMGDRNNHNVVYMGSLVPGKGFHLLAQVWKNVLKRVPDAQLYVVGSGKLYNSNAKLGKYGFAEESYEEKFMPYITDENGVILQSVHLMGVMNEDKYELLGKCKVGIPNPTGVSETFCICGLEMQLMGCNITTLYHPAYLDTIYNKSSLYKDPDQLVEYIINRLLTNNDNYDDLYDFVSKTFNAENSISKWERLFHDFDSNVVEPISDNNYQLKKVKNVLFTLKRRCPIFKIIPPIACFVNVLNLIKLK